MARPLQRAAPVGELGTFRLPTGELVWCRVDQGGRLVAFREIGRRLVPCDPRVLTDAVKLSDDPDWLREYETAGVGDVTGD